MLLVAMPALASALGCDSAITLAPVQTPADATLTGDPRSDAKFALAGQFCAQAKPSADPPADPHAAAGRMAAQLQLYGPQPGPPAALTPRSAPRVPAPPPAALAPPASRDGLLQTRSVQRIRALVPTVADAARRNDIDPLLLHAVAHVESRHNAEAQSPAGAQGVLQVMPATARRFGVTDPARSLRRPDVNMAVGAEYLKTLQARFGNNLPLVLAAYNAGEGAVEKYGRRIPPYPETQAYVREVLATYAQLRRRVPAPGSTSSTGAPPTAAPAVRGGSL